MLWNLKEPQSTKGIGRKAKAATPGEIGTGTEPGFFYDDEGDGDFRGRTENFFTEALGEALSNIGGMTFQLTFLDDLEVRGHRPLLALVVEPGDVLVELVLAVERYGFFIPLFYEVGLEQHGRAVFEDAVDIHLD